MVNCSIQVIILFLKGRIIPGRCLE